MLKKSCFYRASLVAASADLSYRAHENSYVCILTAGFLKLKYVKYFRKKLHRRCLTGFWIRLWVRHFLSDFFKISFTLFPFLYLNRYFWRKVAVKIKCKSSFNNRYFTCAQSQMSICTFSKIPTIWLGEEFIVARVWDCQSQKTTPIL